MSVGGRPPKFKEEYKEQALKLCSKGFTDSDLADFWDVTEQTVNNWKTKYPQFFESLKVGKQFCDEEIEKSLFERAKGYSHKDTKFATHEGMITDQKEYTKHLPPDTTACIFWLKNRKPKEWRDKVETDITTKGDKIESVQFYLPDNNRDN